MIGSWYSRLSKIGSAGAGYAAVDPPVAVTPEVPSADTLDADALAAPLATEVPQQLEVPLTIIVKTPAGIEVGEFEVQKTATVKELKVQLESLQSVQVAHLTLLHAEEILEDTCRWFATSVNDKDVLTLVALYKEPLQDETIKQAVADYFQGPEAKVKMVEKHGELSLWDTSNVTNMEKLFFRQSNFNEDLSAWNVANVTNMSCTFRQASSFNGDLSSWNVGRVTDMSFMFREARSFNGDLSAWNVANVTSMQNMFELACSFRADLSAWNVPDTTSKSFMLNICPAPKPSWL